MRKIVNFILIIFLATTCFFVTISNNFASVALKSVDEYYQSVGNKTGSNLASELHTIISTGYEQKSYNSLWDYYPKTDYYMENGTKYIWDMYSNIKYTFTNRKTGNSEEGAGTNKEHSIPQSWFGEASPMKSDLFHVYPTDCYVNNKRSSYVYGEVKSAEYTSGNGSKLGTSALSSYSGKVFEPIDEYKGDFARTYFYFAIRYSDKIANWSAGEVKKVFSSTYPYLTNYSIELFTKWHIEDPVSQKEIDRNNAVYEIQHNRNPFIDHPEYANDIWGSSYPIGDIETYTVTYNAMGGKFDYTDQTKYQANNLISAPNKSPQLEGYYFVGWYKDKDLTQKWDFSKDKITEDLVLYAKYEEQSELMEAFANEILSVAMHINYDLVVIDEPQEGSEPIVVSEENDFSTYSDGQVEADYFNISISANSAGNLAAKRNDGSLRVYWGEKITVSSEFKIKKIEFTHTDGTKGNTISANIGTYSNKTWTGDANSVEFTISGSSGNIEFQKIVVYFESDGSITPDRYKINQAELLVKFVLSKREGLLAEEDGADFAFMVDGNLALPMNSDPNTYILSVDVSDLLHEYNICGVMIIDGEMYYSGNVIYSIRTLAEKYLEEMSDNEIILNNYDLISFLAGE